MAGNGKLTRLISPCFPSSNTATPFPSIGSNPINPARYTMAPSSSTFRSSMAMLFGLITLFLSCIGLTDHLKKHVVSWFTPRVVACPADRAPARIVEIHRDNHAQIREFNVYRRHHGFVRARRSIRSFHDGSRGETVILVEPAIR